MSTDEKDDEIFNTGAYTAPAVKKQIFDQTKQEVKEAKELPYFEQILLAAKSNNIPVQKPKKNCKRCYERGYIGWDDAKMPIPCDCIFPKKSVEEQKKEQEKGMPLSFYPAKVRRRFKLDQKKLIKKRLKMTNAVKLMKAEIEAELASIDEQKQAIMESKDSVIETLNDIQKEENV